MLIKTYSLRPHCVSGWTAYVLQDDTRSLQCQDKTGRSLSPQRTTKCSRSQNPLMLNELSCWFREPEFSYVGTNALVLLQGVLKMHTYPSAVHVERKILLNMSPTISFLQFCLIYHPSSSSSLAASNGGYRYQIFIHFKLFFFFVTCVPGNFVLNLRRHVL